MTQKDKPLSLKKKELIIYHPCMRFYLPGQAFLKEVIHGLCMEITLKAGNQFLLAMYFD